MFFELLRDGKQALAELPAADRFFRVLWLLGPIFLLIERTPADVWLSLLAIAFVVRSIIIRDGSWLRMFWVRAGFAFLGVCILSSAMSSDPAYSIGEAVAWFRFPLFAMACAFWLGRDRRLLYVMLISIALGIIAMCCILAAEMYLVGRVGNRLTWPYGDFIPGSYLAKAGLPAVIIAVAIAVSLKSRVAIIAGLFALMALAFVILTGERINSIIMLCGGVLAGTLWRPVWSRYFVFVAVGLVAVVAAFQFMPELGERYVGKFMAQLPTGDHSPYYTAMMPGYMAFEQAPILGIGTGNFRHMCPDIIGVSSNLACHPHPHNFYVQLLGETGIIGLIFGTIFICSLIWTCFSAALCGRENIVVATAWVVPFAFFWPIASTADFFGQWNNMFMWSAVALALASSNMRAANLASSQHQKS